MGLPGFLMPESELRCAHAEGDEDPEMVPSPEGSGFLSAGCRGSDTIEMKNKGTARKRTAAQLKNRWRDPEKL